MTKIQIYFTKFNDKLPGYLYRDYLSLFPISLQEKNTKYIRWQDRHAHLFGKLLLTEGLKDYGFSVRILNEIKFNKYDRPYIDSEIDFNISHSGEYVLCAIGKNIRLGVDIEEIKKVIFDDFRQVMTSEQWQDILHSNDSTTSFFNYWTIKESVIKADSRGLSIPLLDILVNDNKVCYDNLYWYIKELNIDKKYCSYLATNLHDITVNLNFIDFYKREVKDIKTHTKAILH